MMKPSDFVRWFRGSSPYIHAHRGKTFVIYFGGEALGDPRFADLVHDFALLNSLGVRLVLVHGIRPQIDSRLARQGCQAQYQNGLRITDRAALECVKEAAGTVRVEIEALFSTGVANSPMAGARVRVASGNFVTAKPVGVRDGVDFQHTGEVRRVDAEGLNAVLARGDVALLSAVGYSPTGEIFNLRSEQVATAAAIALKADKLLLLTEEECLSLREDRLLRQITTAEARALLGEADTLAPEVAPHLKAAVQACEAGVGRAHVLDRHIDGAILLELFTRDGVGTLVSRAPFETLRAALVQDVPGILDLLRPLEQKGVLVTRSRERLESDIGDYTVIERDGMIVGCAALHRFPEARMGELACLALHDDYRGENRGERLLAHIEGKAVAMGFERLFVLTTQTAHWFRERGFEPAEVADLPETRRAAYNPRRNSKVLIKSL
ncbi:amino-acid N-acetyltransferase [Methylomagnum ishizawai]|uniref:amino-acid N-acetyltransferase n=1 Tax=Methylomagnum ishizawai TaxID=1760988 RepID=UPI001C3336DA|nr:amino-acid N-acetyltransferase [Methylomagnum ishizawai]BBL73823.1 amino-acid acetyltransferase [Methylomagnum ishizawai]